MDEYESVKKSSLKFKGEKKKRRRRQQSKDHPNEHIGESSSNNQDEQAEDAEDHGGWWRTETYEHIRDDVAIEFLPGCYAKALSNGSVVLGNPHPPGEGPDDEEIFTAVCVSTNQISFKSGFGRYLGIDTRKRLMGLSEAISEQETFLPVFEDGKLALAAYNDCFLSPDEESEIQQIHARSAKAGPHEMLTLRVSNDPRMFENKVNDKQIPHEDAGSIYETELGYLKKYQSHKTKHVSLEHDKKELKKARIEGQLHEALLDKRVKHKSDKYCK